MELPIFLAFEVTDEDQGYPFAVAWSLPEGQYKSVLIKPEDEWLIDWESGQNAAGAPSVQDLKERGETVLDILKEWAEDFRHEEIYCEDPALAQFCLDMMYDAYGKELTAEVVPATAAFEEVDPFDLDDQRRVIMETEELTAVHAEDIARTYIHLYARINGITG
ncbi:hypothetical protein [Saccharospirillum salsuginis]|uniref:Uncharacterized protein n=1 Tax=Saccharospirillum salsuginis TaxID=418750 RepID=A0A918KIZ5_9GAMM|nr:hypothetical protein [Saccharospirillum salsuginis]GGX65386.1 hypothetical protein GCM10007392_36570 [Saccharospirillum salsuginis]